MDFQFSEQEKAFQDEVEAFLKAELPGDWPEKSMHWPGGYGTMEMSGKELQATGRRGQALRCWKSL